MSEVYRRSNSDRGWRGMAKAAVLAVAIAALTGAGLSGALAKHGDDDWGAWGVASGGSGSGSGSGNWDDDDWFVASGGSGGSGGWDDD